MPSKHHKENNEHDISIDKPEKNEVSNDPFDTVKYPLWIEFKERAPGTHKHTQSILNTLDSITADIDNIDTASLRLAAMYHDVGKMIFPEAFTENQRTEDNIHSDLHPLVSLHLITKHVSDTALILINNNFATKAIKIAVQHHGTTVLRSIYEKAKRNDGTISEDLFRYKAEKPDCLESLILMLCDQVEATSRSIYVDQQKDMSAESIVNSIFNKLMIDGQFDNVDTKLGNINKIQKALIRDVESNFHKRIKYEENDKISEEH